MKDKQLGRLFHQNKIQIGQMIFINLMAKDRRANYCFFSFFKSLSFPFCLLYQMSQDRKEAHCQKCLDDKILSFDCLIDCLPSPPHAQHPMLGTSLWDNRLKQVLWRQRQSGAGDVIRVDLRASD